MEIFNILV